MTAHIPGFLAAERAWENHAPEDEPDRCESGDCDTCPECLAAIAQDEAEALAYEQHKERRWDS